jgi:hypothetical protein
MACYVTSLANFSLISSSQEAYSFALLCNFLSNKYSQNK